MNRKEIERFFRGVAKDYKGRAEVLLTGAAAGSVLGGTRPSLDIDFEVRVKDPKGFPALAEAIERNRKLTGVTADYSEDIDRWGSVSLLDYRKHTRPFLKLGALTVRVLEPAYWSIGKVTRYLQPDIEDLEGVLRGQKVGALTLARLWGRALKASPLSERLILFRKQAEHFLTQVGPRIWGKGYDSGKAVEAFHRSAGIQSGPKKDGE